MAINVRRLWTAIGLAIVAETKGFVHSPCMARVADVNRPTSWSSAVRCAFESRMLQRARLGPAAWGSCGWNRKYGGTLFSAQQSVDGGVMLPPADNLDEYAAFLSDSIRQHLDDEWLPQECHRDIGEEVARLYRAAVQQGGKDMTNLVLDVGSGMEKFDMGDAFVGPWDIANLVSDFLMEKMGAEISGCSAKIPTSSSSSSLSSGVAAAAVAGQSTFRLTAEMVRQMQIDLTADFARYRFLVDFMAGDSKWDMLNTVMAVYQGYKAEDAADGEAGGEGVRRGWEQAYPGPSPPDLRTAEGLVEALEADFPDDPDMLDGLEVIVETVYGGEAKRMDAGDPEKGVPANPLFLRRATVCKWLYMVGFLEDDIKRAPDDPSQLAELISGRARLKTQSK